MSLEFDEYDLNKNIEETSDLSDNDGSETSDFVINENMSEVNYELTESDTSDGLADYLMKDKSMDDILNSYLEGAEELVSSLENDASVDVISPDTSEGLADYLMKESPGDDLLIAHPEDNTMNDLYSKENEEISRIVEESISAQDEIDMSVKNELVNLRDAVADYQLEAMLKETESQDNEDTGDVKVLKR